MKPIEISELVRLLASRAEALAAELLPGGHREGREWTEARRGRGGLGDSLKVSIAGSRAGVWGHFAAGAGGDALDLVAYLLFDGDKARAVAWSKTWLGLESPGLNAADLKVRRREASRRAAEAEAGAAADRERRRKIAQAMWLAAEPRIAGTLADDYLQARGIDLRRLARQPAALRFHPKLWHPELKEEHPAIVAAVSGPEGRGFAACHRTWLEPAAGGRGVSKLTVATAKMTLGTYRGGFIAIWRGAEDPGELGKPLARAAPGSAVLVAEGIEDALSAAVVAPQLRIVCAVSLANLAALALPQAIGEVRLLADNDAPGSPAAAALERAVRHFQAEGRRVFLCRPPGEFKDLNEMLVAEGGAQKTG